MCTDVCVCVNDAFGCILRKISLNVINLKQQKRDLCFLLLFCNGQYIPRNVLMHLSDVIAKMRMFLKGNKNVMKSQSRKVNSCIPNGVSFSRKTQSILSIACNSLTSISTNIVFSDKMMPYQF